ncbi:MAG TPA: alkaline phosphatase family protein [Oculatellaceae cyanobacterium]
MHRLNRILIALTILFLTCCPVWAARHVDHVFIISYDGGKPAVMQQCKMPELTTLVKEGASSWEAQTVFPSLTLVAHTSMLTGLSPEKHKVNWNDWEPEKGIIASPTIFKLAKAQNLTTAMFVGKPKFIHLFQEGSLDDFSLPSHHAMDVAYAAARYIKSNKPNLCFIHFADSDSAGHMFGWGSDQQKEALETQDKALKIVMKSLEEAGIDHDSAVIISADHGGHKRTHGTNTPDDMVIPWIVWGKGVKPGSHPQHTVTTYDTAATALWLLDVPLPENMDGKPVTDVFTAE